MRTTDMRFPPAVWGPVFWLTIHITALGYPEKPTYAQKRAAKEYFEGLQFLLPCPQCREHYKEHLQKNPISPALDNRRDLFEWTVRVHNSVNKMLGKPTTTESQALEYFSRLGGRGKSPILRAQDFSEIDMASFAKGFSAAAAICGVAGAVLWYMRTKHD
jgi:hypothetical protein